LIAYRGSVIGQGRQKTQTKTEPSGCASCHAKNSVEQRVFRFPLEVQGWQGYLRIFPAPFLNQFNGGLAGHRFAFDGWP